MIRFFFVHFVLEHFAYESRDTGRLFCCSDTGPGCDFFVKCDGYILHKHNDSVTRGSCQAIFRKGHLIELYYASFVLMIYCSGMVEPRENYMRKNQTIFYIVPILFALTLCSPVTEIPAVEEDPDYNVMIGER